MSKAAVRIPMSPAPITPMRSPYVYVNEFQSTFQTTIIGWRSCTNDKAVSILGANTAFSGEIPLGTSLTDAVSEIAIEPCGEKLNTSFPNQEAFTPGPISITVPTAQYPYRRGKLICSCMPGMDASVGWSLSKRPLNTLSSVPNRN